jgi:hypothetical protein
MTPEEKQSKLENKWATLEAREGLERPANSAENLQRAKEARSEGS